MKTILIAALVAAVAFAGCTADDTESTNGNGNAQPGDGAQQVDGTIDVVENTNESTEGNGTTNETATNDTNTSG